MLVIVIFILEILYKDLLLAFDFIFKKHISDYPRFLEEIYSLKPDDRRSLLSLSVILKRNIGELTIV